MKAIVTFRIKSAWRKKLFLVCKDECTNINFKNYMTVLTMFTARLNDDTL